ncbi:hypothetical protein [Spiroplasma turonicum]|uniref:Uncharacterized protein n=1 Tax=Spiroplasma turonicum TaxID=216946 RepID=A0A0K1P767_9MOLU|nr:hypothetical protein [Spiroplasma turonicum]AKU79737.1 hypothetical protein STURON_00491 [Spiroplasma turonicum]ALX70755.1 hypothetical protein STURO_v1c04890 [Spiroplasma turonicum]
MNFNISIDKIIFDFYKKDVKGLILNKKFNLNTKQQNDLISISKSDDCGKLFNQLNEYFKKNIWVNEYELSLMLTLITQRYNYFYQTEQEWNRFFENKIFLDNSSDLKQKIHIFFEKQIDIYSNNYINIISKFNIKSWNKTLYKTVDDIFKKILTQRFFDNKIKVINEFINFVKNTKKIYSYLEGIGIESDKQKFLSNTNEIKIIFQSMKDLVEQIIKKIELN